LQWLQNPVQINGDSPKKQGRENDRTSIKTTLREYLRDKMNSKQIARAKVFQTPMEA
jgi:hypothetical protein